MNHPREAWSFYTHFTGALLSAAALIVLIGKPIMSGIGPSPAVVGGIVFGVSLLALYTASSIYHYVNLPRLPLERLRKLDHAMIYVLIAGTYTPVALAYMTAGDATVFMIVIWSVALAGILMKIFWMNAPRLLYTSLYLVMGWAIVFDWKAFDSIPGGCLSLIAAGGISYTIGAVFYAIKKPNLSDWFGFHELFHVFVLLGSLLHFLAVYLYIIR
jgi:hemolysin III